MNRILAFGLFLTVFVTLYGLLNYYVLWRMATFFKIRRGKRFYATFIVLTLALPIAQVIESVVADGVFRIIYIFAMTWAGTVFILACVLGLYEIAHRVVRLKTRLWSDIALALCAILVVVAIACGSIISVHEVDITSPKVTQPLRIVQLTDVHLGPVHRAAYLERVIEKVKELHPDAVVITGDLIDGPGHYDSALLQPFDSLGVPVYFVYGNHEGFANHGLIESLLANTSIIHLNDTAVQFKGIGIVGVDDRNTKDTMASALAGIARNTSEYNLLLYHRPSAHTVVTGTDLMLSGHTHDGQIFPFTLLTMQVENPVWGLHQYGNLSVYVSAGTGTWGPPMRLGSTDEITLIALNPS